MGYIAKFFIGQYGVETAGGSGTPYNALLLQVDVNSLTINKDILTPTSFDFTCNISDFYDEGLNIFRERSVYVVIETNGKVLVEGNIYNVSFGSELAEVSISCNDPLYNLNYKLPQVFAAFKNKSLISVIYSTLMQNILKINNNFSDYHLITGIHTLPKPQVSVGMDLRDESSAYGQITKLLKSNTQQYIRFVRQSTVEIPLEEFNSVQAPCNYFEVGKFDFETNFIIDNNNLEGIEITNNLEPEIGFIFPYGATYKDVNDTLQILNLTDRTSPLEFPDNLRFTITGELLSRNISTVNPYHVGKETQLYQATGNIFSDITPGSDDTPEDTPPTPSELDDAAIELTNAAISEMNKTKSIEYSCTVSNPPLGLYPGNKVTLNYNILYQTYDQHTGRTNASKPTGFNINKSLYIKSVNYNIDNASIAGDFVLTEHNTWIDNEDMVEYVNQLRKSIREQGEYHLNSQPRNNMGYRREVIQNVSPNTTHNGRASYFVNYHKTNHFGFGKARPLPQIPYDPCHYIIEFPRYPELVVEYMTLDNTSNRHKLFPKKIHDPISGYGMTIIAFNNSNAIRLLFYNSNHDWTTNDSIEYALGVLYLV